MNYQPPSLRIWVMEGNTHTKLPTLYNKWVTDLQMDVPHSPT